MTQDYLGDAACRMRDLGLCICWQVMANDERGLYDKRNKAKNLHIYDSPLAVAGPRVQEFGICRLRPSIIELDHSMCVVKHNNELSKGFLCVSTFLYLLTLY
jgi:hypothetical protein